MLDSRARSFSAALLAARVEMEAITNTSEAEGER